MSWFSNSAMSFGLAGDYGLLTNPARAWDTFKNGTVNETNEKIAQENLAYQYENLDYQKALNQTIFDRADSAYQRTVEDMRNAGLNPLTMTGTNEVGNPIATEAPHNDFQAQDKGIAQVLNEVMGVGNALEDWQIGQEKLRQEKATADQMESEANLKNMFLEDEINKRKRQYNLDEKSYNDFLRNYNFNEKHGFFNGMAENERLAQILSNPQEQKEFKNQLLLGSLKSIAGDITKINQFGINVGQKAFETGKEKGKKGENISLLDFFKILSGN